LTDLGRLADSGSLTVNVDHALPLAEAAEAFRLSAGGRTRGKIVLEVD
ncbi:zinc-binding dehydrogenase, partial [Streptomyces pristinaespiralis]